MAITTLLAAGTSAAQSSDVVLADGAVATLSVTGQGVIYIQTKTVGGYSTQGSIGSIYVGRNGCQLIGPMTFRVCRGASSAAVGCDMEKA